MRIPTRADADAIVRELVETTHYFDEETGEWYEPAEPPEVADDDERGDR